MNRTIRVELVIIAMLMLAGCGAEVMLVTKGQSFTGKDTMSLPTAREDITDMIVDVGKSMGYKRFSVSDKNGTRSEGSYGGWTPSFSLHMPADYIAIVNFSATTNIFVTGIIGKSGQSHLTINVKDKGKLLDIAVSVSGNFKSGTEDACRNLLEDFKSRLSARLAE